MDWFDTLLQCLATRSPKVSPAASADPRWVSLSEGTTTDYTAHSDELVSTRKGCKNALLLLSGPNRPLTSGSVDTRLTTSRSLPCQHSHWGPHRPQTGSHSSWNRPCIVHQYTGRGMMNSRDRPSCNVLGARGCQSPNTSPSEEGTQAAPTRRCRPLTQRRWKRLPQVPACQIRGSGPTQCCASSRYLIRYPRGETDCWCLLMRFGDLHTPATEQRHMSH